VVAALWFPGIIRRTGPSSGGLCEYANESYWVLGHTLFGVWSPWGGREPLSYTVPWLQVAGLDFVVCRWWCRRCPLAAMVVIFWGEFFLAQVYAFWLFGNGLGAGRGFFSLLAFF
jgi:hypothetical protein